MRIADSFLSRTSVLRLLAFTAVPLSAVILCGCPGAKQDTTTGTTGTTGGPAPVNADKRDAASSGAFAQTDPWKLTTTDPNAVRGNHGIYLSNGYIGTTFGASGDAGKDSVTFIAGHYDAQEKLLAVPNWHQLGLPEPRSGEPYEQTLDMQRGVLTTKRGGTTVTAFLIGGSAYQTACLHIEGNVPDNLPKMPANGDAAGWTINDIQESDGSWTRLASYYSTAGPSTYKPPRSYAEALKAQEALWAKRWATADIAVDGDPEAQQLVHKLLFDLIQSTRVGGEDSVAPEALSGDFYKGHIFWDADIWMFPALLAQYPEAAKNLLDYRFRHLEQAKAIAHAEGFAGADYPWESAASGKETAPGGFSTERHVTAGVGWAVWQYYLATGDKNWLSTRGYPVLSAVADHFASRAQKDAAGAYHIRGVFGPDENKGKVDDNTYTNALARYVLLAAGTAAKTIGKPADPKWATVAQKIALPFDKTKGAYLARADDDLKPTKQADGELVVYPAKLPMDTKTAAATFDLNASRPIKNGPAMTASMHALIAARLGRAPQAESAFRDSYRPFERGPFLLFSEKRSMERCVFTTGTGGVLQSIIYGFGGLDFDDWERKGSTSTVLPTGWKQLKISGIQHNGKRYTLTVNSSSLRTLVEEKK